MKAFTHYIIKEGRNEYSFLNIIKVDFSPIILGPLEYYVYIHLNQIYVIAIKWSEIKRELKIMCCMLKRMRIGKNTFNMRFSTNCLRICLGN